MNVATTDSPEALQEKEYEFPYHYLPQFEHGKDGKDGKVALQRTWLWSYKYLSGISYLLDRLSRVKVNSVIDVGCGDGRVLNEVAKHYSSASLVGVDSSQRAINFAKAFNPELDFRVTDIVKEPLHETFDVVLLVEVLEHIPPEAAEPFLRALSKLMHDDSVLFLTVPHTNLALNPKHYRHFNEESLREVLGPFFEIEQVDLFDRHTKSLIWLQKLVYNRFSVLVHPWLQTLFYRGYRKWFFEASSDDAHRIAIIAKRRR